MPRTKKATPSVTLKAFHDWAREAEFNAELTYCVEGGARHEALFKYARKLQHAGLVMLFQRRGEDGLFRYFAKRSPVRAHVALDKLSASIHAPPSAAALASRQEERL